jgi:methionine synthase I (cobalamin-dependent)
MSGGGGTRLPRLRPALADSSRQKRLASHMKGFRERLQNNEVVVFDGGVGTYLYEKGIYINTCFDELNITNPDIVSEVHRD